MRNQVKIGPIWSEKRPKRTEKEVVTTTSLTLGTPKRETATKTGTREKPAANLRISTNPTTNTDRAAAVRTGTRRVNTIPHRLNTIPVRARGTTAAAAAAVGTGIRPRRNPRRAKIRISITVPAATGNAAGKRAKIGTSLRNRRNKRITSLPLITFFYSVCFFFFFLFIIIIIRVTVSFKLNYLSSF